jgi:hypothetical protein
VGGGGVGGDRGWDGQGEFGGGGGRVSWGKGWWGRVLLLCLDLAMEVWFLTLSLVVVVAFGFKVRTARPRGSVRGEDSGYGIRLRRHPESNRESLAP